jgi:heat shock protein HslJ
MADDQTRSSGRRSPSVEIQTLISMFAAAVLMTAVAVLAIAIVGLPPPRLVLTGATWQWTGSTSGAGESPLAVPVPEAYTIRFAGDRTFEAVADCNRVTGTYGVVPAGRAGGATNGLALVPAPTGVVSCGAESLSDQFLQQLGTASHYVIAGSQLTITLYPDGTMTFAAAVPGVSPSPGG